MSHYETFYKAMVVRDDMTQDIYSSIDSTISELQTMLGYARNNINPDVFMVWAPILDAIEKIRPIDPSYEPKSVTKTYVNNPEDICYDSCYPDSSGCKCKRN